MAQKISDDLARNIKTLANQVPWSRTCLYCPTEDINTSSTSVVYKGTRYNLSLYRGTLTISAGEEIVWQGDESSLESNASSINLHSSSEWVTTITSEF